MVSQSTVGARWLGGLTHLSDLDHFLSEMKHFPSSACHGREKVFQFSLYDLIQSGS